MLVTFRCKVYADILMFGDVAQQLIRLMGHSGTIPGAIPAEEVEAARQRLQQAMARDAHENGNDEDAVSLRKRAFTLMQMLDAAAEEACYITWE